MLCVCKKIPVATLCSCLLSLLLMSCGGGGSSSAPEANPSVAVLASIIDPGAICANGGALIQSGIDDNGNGVLDPAEVDNEDIICNGVDGVDGTNGTNGTNGTDGVDGTNGANGLNSLIAQSVEPAGSNCNYGGIRIDSGLDLDSSNTLDPGEISATAYICNVALDVAANGFPVTDAWGETWDGFSRPLATYAEAAATCTTLGARLPTATELYRNNLVSGLTNSSISVYSSTEPLWTQIPTVSSGTRVTVRLSDGVTSSSAESTENYYRCVWPNTSPTAFSGGACNGLPGNECWGAGPLENVDSIDRLPLDYAGAAAECAMANASIPVLADWQEQIHAGLPNGSDTYLWSANAMYWYNGNYGYSTVRWGATDPSQWQYGTTPYPLAALNYSTAKVAFRCIGSSMPEQLVAPVAPSCNGGCFSTGERRSGLIADSVDRTATTQDQAVNACLAEGAELGNQADMAELIHAGLPNGSNNWLWLSDPVYWYSNNYGNALVRWTGTGDQSWNYNNTNGSMSYATNSYAYRCVWRAKVDDLPVCSGTDGIEQTLNSYQCVASTDGDPAGNSAPDGVPLIDTWGNAWDTTQRAAAVKADAEADCAALGGRLPSASELYAVRNGQLLSPALADATATDLLWTQTPSYSTDSSIVIRLSDGVTTTIGNTGTSPYRCVWPSSKGNVLSGQSCYGDCFTPDTTTIADAHDRPALPVNAAIEECDAAGGHLPDMRELQSLIHQGWDNGSYNWLWTAESMYWYSGGYGYPLSRWSGSGQTDWQYLSGTTGTVGQGASSYPFRCVYSSKAR